MQTLGMKYGTKNTKERSKDCKTYGTIDLSFKLKLKLIVFFNSQFWEIKLFRHNKFLLQYRYVDKLKITMKISFAKLPYNIFKACLNLMCQQEALNHPVAVIPQGVDLAYLQTGISGVFMGFEFGDTVFFGYWSQLLYFFGLLNESCILKCFIFSTVFFGSSFIHQVLQ